MVPQDNEATARESRALQDGLFWGANEPPFAVAQVA